MHHTFKWVVPALLAVPMVASAQNLITNGSFESNLDGWTATVAPSGSSFPVSVITYGPPGAPYPGGAFNEIVPVDNAASASPDAAGTQGAYFVKDNGELTLSQSFTAASTGLYNYGFSFYVPANGFANPFDATLTASIGTSSFSSTIGALPSATWTAQSGTVALTAGSTYTFAFTFTGNGVTAKDIVVDRVYVTAVPEPGTYAMLAAGLLTVGFVALRRKG